MRKADSIQHREEEAPTSGIRVTSFEGMSPEKIKALLTRGREEVRGLTRGVEAGTLKAHPDPFGLAIDTEGKAVA